MKILKQPQQVKNKAIEELSNRLKENPNYSLPEGYTKHIEKEFTYEYNLPSYYQIPESKRISILILDSLCDSLFQFHFIEPIVKYTKIIKIRPSFKLPQSSKDHFLSKPERKNTLEPISQANILPTTTSLSPSLKLEIGRFPFDQRPLVTTVAWVLEEILQWVISGRTSLPPTTVTSLTQATTPIPSAPPAPNRVVRQRLDSENQEKLLQQQKEEKRRKRERALKAKLSQVREVKEKLILEQDSKEERKSSVDKKELRRKRENEKKKTTAFYDMQKFYSKYKSKAYF